MTVLEYGCIYIPAADPADVGLHIFFNYNFNIYLFSKMDPGAELIAQVQVRTMVHVTPVTRHSL